jgi:O-acetyl-ADP-ribose deacetylase
LTKAYDLPAKYVIHAVGPIWRGGTHAERALLEKAYESSFARAAEAGDVRSIAFPAISTGIYGFPKADAARIAVASMLRHESEYEGIVACLFDSESVRLYREALAAARG